DQKGEGVEDDVHAHGASCFGNHSLKAGVT
ncbi:MAG: hypothetical protein ACJAWZ_000759, partial [Paracoccaceae bacterium]